ncbi:MAG: hypothetical protein ACJ74U_16215 [Jatrophihabitantaceae bacterium]
MSAADHDGSAFTDDNLVVGHIWNAGPAKNGIRPLYVATDEVENIDGESVRLIRQVEVRVEQLRALLE